MASPWEMNWEVPKATGMPWEQNFDTAPQAPSEPFNLTKSAIDVAKQIPSGVASGLASMATAPYQIANLGMKGIDALATKFLPESISKGWTEAGKKVDAVGGIPRPDIINTTLESALPKPETRAGKYARTGAEFAGGALGTGSNVLRTGIIPGLASEGAGQLTEGTAAEPYARIATALGTTMLAGKRTPANVPTAEEIKDAARTNYQHPVVTSLEIKPSSVGSLADDILSDLNNQGFRARNASGVFSAVDALRKPVGATAKVADIDSVRKELGLAAGNFSNPTEQAAAAEAIRKIDKYLVSIKPTDVVAGDARRASQLLDEARQNWASASRSQKVAKALSDAEVNASSANSGANLDNATRQALKPILKNPKNNRGFSPEEIAQLNKTVRGTIPGNAARLVGNILGGGGGLGAAIVGGGASYATDDLRFLGLPALGYGFKKMGSASTRGNAAKLDEMLRARSPLAASNPAAQQVTPQMQAIINALMASGQLRGAY